MERDSGDFGVFVRMNEMQANRKSRIIRLGASR